MDYKSQMQCGKDLYERGDYRTARLEFSGATITAPTDTDKAEAWYYLGKVEYHLQHYGESVVAYRRSLEQGTPNTNIYYNIGVALTRQEKCDEALDAFNEAITANPTDDGAWYNKGIILRELKRTDEALAALTQAIALNPDNAKYGDNVIAEMQEATQ